MKLIVRILISPLTLLSFLFVAFLHWVVWTLDETYDHKAAIVAFWNQFDR